MPDHASIAPGMTFRRSDQGIWLMAPYALWVMFAALLNLKIWQLNSGKA